MNILGCMSGSSLDGLDLALCRFHSEYTYDLVKSETISYSNEWVERLKNIQNLTHAECCLLEAEYTSYIATLIQGFVSGQTVDYISSHGHTIVHHPEMGYSYQLGQGAYLVSKTAIPVISEFRLQDIAKGGQGAPIAPAVEKYLLPDYDAYLNLGGISNISIHKNDSIRAYDIGPCNQLLNALARLEGKTFDEGGALAKSGSVLNDLLDHSLSHVYYKNEAPKSLDNQFVVQEFVKPFLEHQGKNSDKLRTAVELITLTITAETEENNTVLATGGGALNTFLMTRLEEELQQKDNNLIIPEKEMVEFKEAILMALMGYLRISNKVNVFSSVTGASSDSIAGCIYTC